jgi:hypothetical protein
MQIKLLQFHHRYGVTTFTLVSVFIIIIIAILHKTKKLMYQAFVQINLLYGAETWTLNTQQANKLLATEMDFWRSARKSMKEQVRNSTIREVMEVG